MTPTPGGRLDGGVYVDLLERDGALLADAAERDLEAHVPGCPAWTAADLVWHTGGVHYAWGTIARERSQEPKLERPARPPQHELIAWYRSTLAATAATLRDADPEAQVWTWASEKNVAWIRRRVAHETAVHRWDAESAVGDAQPIDTALAVDGITEFLEFFVSDNPDSQDVSVHLHATDTDGEWLAEIKGGRLELRREHAKGDVALRGAASDLLLLLWGRLPEAAVAVHGDRAALFRFLESAKLD